MGNWQLVKFYDENEQKDKECWKMQELFYYQDVMMKEFDATIQSQQIDVDGRKYIVLDNTAFYPTGGGQPHDTGMLNNVKVIDVERIDDEIRHYVDELLPEGTKKVHGVLDWKRRFDHMQQHAGQHILTAAFVEILNYPTVSFHLGTETVTIDIDVPNLSDQELAFVEKRANEIILENRPMKTKWVTQDELANYTLRKAVAVTGEIRLVIIPDYDYNGCGGTHPTSTGQVQAIKIIATEKQKKKTRVHFVCGSRVLQELHWRKKELSETARLVNAPEEEAARAVTKLLQTQKSLEKSLADAHARILSFEAKELLHLASNHLIHKIFTSRSVQELQQLARAIVAADEKSTVLFVSEQTDRVQFVAAKGQSAPTDSMKRITNTILPIIKGKGGGSDSFVQGGGEPTISAEELLEEMIRILM
ncbi:alanine--tRNA ligase-related protein [Rummeliibacillus sp. POC4]|uniref:alanyl-tRNA editing protein n=1 Tax=Rummeliibacillus sp. POC4 TaxID=2305899 RepID=UPI0021017B13|nr:alanine--tRNA ligase-related protein [Rummeliibacillus sp. POC4]